MTNTLTADQLAPSKLADAQANFFNKEAANWIQVQIQPTLRVANGICKIFYLDFDENNHQISFNKDLIAKDCRELLGMNEVSPSYYKTFLLNRRNFLHGLTSDVMTKFFEDSHESDIETIAESVIAYIDENLESLGENSYSAIGNLLLETIKAETEDYTQQTQTKEWFINLSNDWDITYFADGTVAEDPQMA